MINKFFISSKVLVLIILLFQSSIAAAEIYSYINDSGRKIYVDRLSQIPSKFRKNITKRTVRISENTKSEQAAFDIENKALEKKLTITNVISKLEKSINSITSNVFISRNQVFVPVEISHGSRVHKLNLLLDTGANITVLHSQSLPFFKKDNRKSSFAKIANGSIIKTWGVSLQEIEFGPYSNENHHVVVIEHQGNSNFDGLLGMDLLAQTSYQIDFNNQKITWDKDKLYKIKQEIESLKLQLR